MGDKNDQTNVSNSTNNSKFGVSADDNEKARVSEGCRVGSKSSLLARAGDEEGAIKRDETRFKLSKCREEFSGLKKASGKKFWSLWMNIYPLHGMILNNIFHIIHG